MKEAAHAGIRKAGGNDIQAEIGVEAAEMLVKHLQGEEKLSGSIAVEAGAWIEGATIGTVVATRSSKVG